MYSNVSTVHPGLGDNYQGVMFPNQCLHVVIAYATKISLIKKIADTKLSKIISVYVQNL